MATRILEGPVQEYEFLISSARKRFVERMAPLFSEMDRRVQSLFLIHFCAQGVSMTEPVADWIRRAGDMTRRKGFEELGRALGKHAAHEDGHHRMMIADTHSLVAWWNAANTPELAADSFLQMPNSAGVQRYRQLHEDCIAGQTPYGQIAIEYEIEKVSVDWGPKLFSFLIQKLGVEVLKCLSFIQDHMVIDIGHTQYNQRAMSRFLEQTPEAMDALVQTGSDALDCYAAYIEDCMRLAKHHPALR